MTPCRLKQSCHLDGTCLRARLPQGFPHGRLPLGRDLPPSRLRRNLLFRRETRQHPPASPPAAYDDRRWASSVTRRQKGLASHCLDGVALPSSDLIRSLSTCQGASSHMASKESEQNRTATAVFSEQRLVLCSCHCSLADSGPTRHNATVTRLRKHHIRIPNFRRAPVQTKAQCNTNLCKRSPQRYGAQFAGRHR